MLHDFIRNLDRDSQSYKNGRLCFRDGKSICDAPVYGTSWDQANWLAGWTDELADAIRALQHTGEKG